MKPNRSSQRTNLVAGTWMPLTLTLLALALVGPSQLYAGQEADKDLAQQIFDTMVAPMTPIDRRFSRTRQVEMKSFARTLLTHLSKM